MYRKRNFTTGVALALLVFALVLGPGRPSRAEPAASITVLSPTGAPSDVLPEGEDYFTLVLGDPRDMNQRLDLRWQYSNVTSISVQNGLWSARGGSYVYPLFPGVSGAANIGQTGQDFPIDGDRFSRFSVRAQSSSSSNVNLYYYTGPFTGATWAGSDHLEADGMHTLWWDISWSGEIAGLRLGISGDPFVVDWVRLTDPTTSPTYTITWSATDVDSVNIYCDTDTDPAVLDHPIVTGVDADLGAYPWETGYLAPGTYYVYIEDAGGLGVAAYSPGPLTIQPAPVAEVVAPSRTSGDDYATTELGDPWDMSDSGDVEWMNQLASVTFSNGKMHATTTGVDPYIHLASAGTDTIDTGYYLHFNKLTG